ncbi:NAD(P)-binding protein [Aspergillus alliaceus]|uniref:NAD(P)-binding protein n=1 Tax=Petromyces alliaceus TaxID=209559 RepID=A0A5N7CAD1_PETAA|nr:NAD(P)-binding protein [Aspergillus alliaceus]
MVKVLLTGGSGFIAAHIIDILLQRGYETVVTVRSEDKGQKILNAHPNIPKEKLSYVIVKDVAEEGAFDEAVKSNPPFDYVLHTASPFHYNVSDPVKDFLDPAIKGTTGILKAIKVYAPTVKRVVVTSSFAAIVNVKQHAKVYSEEVWNPVTWEEAMDPAQTYRASKTFAEKAAWDFVEKEKPNFDIATINPPLVLGPVVPYLNSLDAVNTSNSRISNMVRGNNKDGLPPTGTFLWVDVHDVALAHVRAIEVSEAGGQRFFLVAGLYTNKDLADIIRETYPQLEDKLPPKDSPSDLPGDVYGYNNKKSIEVLGIQYRSLKDSVADTVKSLLEVARLSPTANLLRKSRLFALPQALQPPQDPPTSKVVFESDTATLPHPIRASIVTPGSSLARGDWGLKRPLPAKSTSAKSSRPIVRVKALDTFEHVTDFESAADHTVTLEKFQELHMPLSLPSKVNYATSIVPRHQSPFESHVDNTDTSKGLGETGAKQFRHAGPWLAGQTEAEFNAYLKKVRNNKPELLQRLRERFLEKRSTERRKQAQDNGEDLETLGPIQVTEEEFQTYLKSLRTDPFSLGPVVFELLDLPSPPAVPSDRIGHKYYQSPGTKLSSAEYAVSGPPKTHPSAGLSYTRSHALIYNHPKFGPQAYQRPVEARILRPKGRFKGKTSKAIAGVGGIAVEDLNAMTFAEQGSPPGLAYFDASIPGGAKYWVTPIRASVDSEGRIGLASYRASATAKAPYNIEDYKKPSMTTISDVARGDQRFVPRMDRHKPRFRPSFSGEPQPQSSTEDVAKSLMKTLSS